MWPWSTISDLRCRLKTTCGAFESTVTQLGNAKVSVRALESQNKTLIAHNAALGSRVVALKAQLAKSYVRDPKTGRLGKYSIDLAQTEQALEDTLKTARESGVFVKSAGFDGTKHWWDDI